MQVQGLSKAPFYALIESISDEPNKAEAQIKTVFIKPKTIDHLIISQELARQLGIDPQMGRKDVRILEVYQKIEDIDLDKI